MASLSAGLTIDRSDAVSQQNCAEFDPAISKPAAPAKSKAGHDFGRKNGRAVRTALAGLAKGLRTPDTNARMAKTWRPESRMDRQNQRRQGRFEGCADSVLPFRSSRPLRLHLSKSRRGERESRSTAAAMPCRPKSGQMAKNWPNMGSRDDQRGSNSSDCGKSRQSPSGGSVRGHAAARIGLPSPPIGKRPPSSSPSPPTL